MTINLTLAGDTYRIEYTINDMWPTIYKNNKAIFLNDKGNLRHVYKIGKYIFKVERAPGQNNKEIAVWKKAKKLGLTRYLAPIVTYRKTKTISVVVQKYIPGRHPSINAWLPRIDALIPLNIGDMHNQNWKKTGKKSYKIVDYGM